MLHAAMSTVLAWPPAVLDEIARWLAPAAASPMAMIRIRPTERTSIRPRSHRRRPDRRHAACRQNPPRPVAGKDRRAAPRGATGRPGPERRQAGRRCQDPTDRLSANACESSPGASLSRRTTTADGGWSRRRRARVEPRPPSPRCEGGGRTRTRRAGPRLCDGSNRSRPMTGVRVPRCTEGATGEPRRGERLDAQDWRCGKARLAAILAGLAWPDNWRCCAQQTLRGP